MERTEVIKVHCRVKVSCKIRSKFGGISNLNGAVSHSWKLPFLTAAAKRLTAIHVVEQ